MLKTAEIFGSVPNDVAKFLDLLAWSEATSTSTVTQDRGYDVIVTGADGKPEIFTDYSQHPFMSRPPKLIRESDHLLSSASGRYQFIRSTWNGLRVAMRLPDFSPLSQDKACVQMLKDRYAYAALVAGDIEKAIHLCSSTWASLPGSTAGQNPHALAKVLDYWQYLAKFAPYLEAA